MPYKCSLCGQEKERQDFHESKASDRNREVTSQCKECRKESYYNQRYKEVCSCCLKHRPLDKNSVCRKCNAESGLRQCKGKCGRILPLFLYYYGRSCICKDCLKERNLSVVKTIQQMLKQGFKVKTGFLLAILQPGVLQILKVKALQFLAPMNGLDAEYSLVETFSVQ